MINADGLTIENDLLKRYRGRGCTVTIPEDITAISYSAFKECSHVTEVTIPKGVRSIGDSAFKDCTSLKSIVIPQGVTSISYDTFYNCESLESVTLPEGLISIESNAFKGCKSLKSIVIPQGVTSISKAAFCNCENLESIVLPSSLCYIDTEAFSGCESLRSCVFANTEEQWLYMEPHLYRAPYHTLEGKKLDVSDPETAAKTVAAMCRSVFAKRAAPPLGRPQFISPVPAPTESSFAVQGMNFEYISVDDSTAAMLAEQVKPYLLHSSVKKTADCTFNHFHFSPSETFSEKTGSILELHTMTDPLSEENCSGDVLVVDGTVKGVVLYLGKGCFKDGHGADKIQFNKSSPEKNDPFSVFYLNGEIIGINSRSYSYVTTNNSSTVEYLSIIPNPGIK